MIPIKFKLWDKINHKWVDEDKYDIYINSEGKGCVGYMIEYEDECRYKNLEYIVEKRINYTPNPLEHQFKVVLWTGFKDSNNKEIYEGDILEYEYRLFGKFYGIVKFDVNTGIWIIKRKAGNDFLYNFISKYDPAVVGNIYENPELINN